MIGSGHLECPLSIRCSMNHWFEDYRLTSEAFDMIFLDRVGLCMADSSTVEYDNSGVLSASGREWHIQNRPCSAGLGNHFFRWSNFWKNPEFRVSREAVDRFHSSVSFVRSVSQSAPVRDAEQFWNSGYRKRSNRIFPREPFVLCLGSPWTDSSCVLEAILRMNS